MSARELGYERRLREWVRKTGAGWERLRYGRWEAGGEVVAYRLTPSSPPRALLLAVHGAGNDALFAMSGLFRAVLQRGVEVFAFDLDGHGRGSTTRLLPGVVEGAVAAAVRQSGALERGLPLHGVGVSLGGALLLHALPRLPFASAALLSAPLRVELSWAAIRRELGAPLLRTLWRERDHYGLTGLIPSFGPVKRHVYPLRLGVQPGPGPFGYVDVLNDILDGLRLEDAARRTSCPVLLAYGGRDRLVPRRQAERLAELLPSAELLLLPRETHLTAPMAPAVTGRVVERMETCPVPGAPCPGRQGEDGATRTGHRMGAGGGGG